MTRNCILRHPPGTPIVDKTSNIIAVRIACNKFNIHRGLHELYCLQCGKRFISSSSIMFCTPKCKDEFDKLNHKEFN